MILAFYKSKGKLFSLDNLVDKLSGGGGFSHVEAIVGDTWFSSSAFDSSFDYYGNYKKNGTRYKIIEPSPDRWEFIQLTTTVEQDNAFVRWFNTEDVLNARYDFLGVSRFVFPFLKESKTKYFCSEVVVDGLKHVKYFTDYADPYKFSPNSFYKKLRGLE